MRLKSISIEITEMDNSAFDGDQSIEVVRILKDAVRRIEETGNFDFPLKDVNGNTVGQIFSMDED